MTTEPEGMQRSHTYTQLDGLNKIYFTKNSKHQITNPAYLRRLSIVHIRTVNRPKRKNEWSANQRVPIGVSTQDIKSKVQCPVCTAPLWEGTMVWIYVIYRVKSAL